MADGTEARAGGLAPGTRIDTYEVAERLGAGGMGEVYRARDVRLGRSVALKVLRPELAASPEQLQRLEQEARSASALNHPNIVHIYGLGGGDGLHYIAMELVLGTTLRRLLAAGPLPLSRLVDLGGQIAEGLAKAHAAGIVHRDLKPENVMVTPDGLVKILDFGLAKLMSPPLADVSEMATIAGFSTRPGMIVGTIEYMSPEQASGLTVDHRTDQFAFGLLLYEMATGRIAFRRETAPQSLAAIIEGEPEPLENLAPTLPAALHTLVRRCLAKDPARRYEIMADAARALAQVAADASPTPPRAGAPTVVTGEILTSPPVVYHVQREGKVRTYDEAALRAALHRHKFTGLELVRRSDEDRWLPLCESAVFGEEVPHTGNPRNVARLRALRAFGGHLMGFVIGGFFATSGFRWLPFWFWIWAFFLGLHAVRVLPVAIALLRSRRDRPELAPDAARRVVAVAAPLPLPLPPPPAPEERLSHSLRAEVVAIRRSLDVRGGVERNQLQKDVDGIVNLLLELDARQAELTELCGGADRERLAAAAGEAEQHAEGASLIQDRMLYVRQRDAIRDRIGSLEKAERALGRVGVRRDVAEHQLRQLRIDLARGAAGELGATELTSRLDFIRHEVDAGEEVEEILARKT